MNGTGFLNGQHLNLILFPLNRPPPEKDLSLLTFCVSIKVNSFSLVCFSQVTVV